VKTNDLEALPMGRRLMQEEGLLVGKYYPGKQNEFKINIK